MRTSSPAWGAAVTLALGLTAPPAPAAPPSPSQPPPEAIPTRGRAPSPPPSQDVDAALLDIARGRLRRAEATLARALHGPHHARASAALADLGARTPAPWKTLARWRAGDLGGLPVEASTRRLAERLLTCQLGSKSCATGLLRQASEGVLDQLPALTRAAARLAAGPRAQVLAALHALAPAGSDLGLRLAADRIQALEASGQRAQAARAAHETMRALPGISEVFAPAAAGAPLDQRLRPALGAFLRHAARLHLGDEARDRLLTSLVAPPDASPEVQVRAALLRAEVGRRTGSSSAQADALREAGFTLARVEGAPRRPLRLALADALRRAARPGDAAATLAPLAARPGRDSRRLRLELASLPAAALERWPLPLGADPEDLALRAALARRRAAPGAAAAWRGALAKAGPLQAARLVDEDPGFPLGLALRGLAQNRAVLRAPDAVLASLGARLVARPPLHAASLWPRLAAFVGALPPAEGPGGLVLEAALPQDLRRSLSRHLVPAEVLRLRAQARRGQLAAARTLVEAWPQDSTAAALLEPLARSPEGLELAATLEGLPPEAPRATSSLRLAARLRRAQGQGLRALAAALRALERAPDDPRTWALTRQLLRPERGHRYLLQGWSAHVENRPRLALKVREAWRLVGRENRGIAVLARAAQASPADPEVLASLGRLRLTRQGPAKALANLAGAHRLADGAYREDTSLFFALALARTGRQAEALQLYRVWMLEAADPTPLAGELLALATTSGFQDPAQALVREVLQGSPTTMAD